MKKIPFILILSRIFIALLIAFITLLKVKNIEYWIVFLISIGLLTDVFDGIIARKLNVATKKLRIWDSNADQLFWIISIVCIFYLNFTFLKENYIPISFVIFLELLCYMISFFKFKKTIATHSILAKFWTISLLIFLIDLTLNNSSNISFWTCIVIGIISRIEILLIILFLKKWTTDVPSIFVVSTINKGIPFKKNSLFN